MRKRYTKAASSILKQGGWKREEKGYESHFHYPFELFIIYIIVLCNAHHLVHMNQLQQWKEQSMEKVWNGIEKTSESCDMLKTVPALALYLGLIHFNFIFILFATFFLSPSKALLLVFYFLICLQFLYHLT